MKKFLFAALCAALIFSTVELLLAQSAQGDLQGVVPVAITSSGDCGPALISVLLSDGTVWTKSASAAPEAPWNYLGNPLVTPTGTKTDSWSELKGTFSSR